MFLKRMKMVVVTLLAFIVGIIFAIQWMGTDYGMSLYELVRRPDVVEKVVEVEVVKIIVVSDDRDIAVINQEYRESLLRISAVEYNSGSASKTYKIMKSYAVKALSFPEKMKKD